MGENSFQKIVKENVLETKDDGSVVLQLKKVWCHEITLPPAVIDATSRGIDEVFNPNCIKVMIDHVNPPKDKASAIQSKITRDWAKKHGIEFAEIGRNGVCHALIPEKGWVKPGDIGIMGDSHTCTHGAFCAIAAGVGSTEVEIGIITGLWTCSPQKVIKVNFKGNVPDNVYSKDMILTLIKKIGVKGATNAVLEFGGEVIEKMSMEARMTITNMAVEAGATTGMINADETTFRYLYNQEPKKWSPEWEEFTKWNSDPDAIYDLVIDIDVTEMKPVMTDKYSPGDVVNVKELAGKKVDQVYIGSCTNGRIEDLRVAAYLFHLTGKKVAEDTRCIVVPATQYIYEKAVQEGLVGIFLKAGCYVNGPTCGACLGMSCGVIAPGEVCVSTTNRNFPGRMGEGGMVHLTSPLTAAFIAVMGEIAEIPKDKDICKEIKKTLKRIERRSPESANLSNWKDIPFVQPNYIEMSKSINAKVNTDFDGDIFLLDKKNVDTDQIIPARYLNETDKKFFGIHCLEDAGLSTEEKEKLFKSKILVADENFGCGSSREHAPWALEAAGIRCVLAPSFARIFENNMFANGLIAMTITKERLDEIRKLAPGGGLLGAAIDWEDEKVISEYRKSLIREGGIIPVMIKKAAEFQIAEKI